MGGSKGLTVFIVFLVVIGLYVLFATSFQQLFTGNVVRDVEYTSSSGETVVCNTPYIRFEEGCCLDRDGNSICDNDEVPQDIEPWRYYPPTCTIAPGFACEDKHVAFYEEVSKYEIEIRIRLANEMNLRNSAIAINVPDTTVELCRLRCQNCEEGNSMVGGVLYTWKSSNCDKYGSVGDYFEGDIALTYTPVGGTQHTRTGTLKVPVE